MRWTLATIRARSRMVNGGTFRVTRDADVDRILPFAVVVVGALKCGVVALPLARRTYRLELLYPDRQDHVMTAAVQVNKLGPRLVLMCRPVLRCSHLLVGTLRRVAHLLHAHASCFPSCILPRTTQHTTLLRQKYSLDADAHAVRLARRANELDLADPDHAATPRSGPGPSDEPP
jgi:hypothetical protein